MLLGAEASRQSEGPFSAAQELLGLFRGGGRTIHKGRPAMHPEPSAVPGTLPWSGFPV